MSVTNQVYGLCNSGETLEYYTFPEKSGIIIPYNVDYTKNGVRMNIDEANKIAIVNVYNYYTDLITDSNEKRVEYMKEFLTETSVKEIKDLNDFYNIGISYEVYNKDGKLILSGVSTVASNHAHASILKNVEEGDLLRYRKALWLNGMLEISLPQTSHYGIKCAYNQYPYVLKLKKVIISSSIGDISYGYDYSCQKDEISHSHANAAHYCHFHGNYGCDGLLCNNFASNFITNANIGSTVIDQIVVPTELVVPADIQEIILASFDLNSSEFTINISNDVNIINVNFEVLFDNLMKVYDKKDIDDIIESNNNPIETDPDDTDTGTITPVDGPTGEDDF